MHFSTCFDILKKKVDDSVKKIGVIIFLCCSFLFVGCQKQEEVVVYECSLWGSLEFYDASYVTEIYSKDQKNVSKIHITNSYSARWDDVDTTSLIDQLNTEKSSMYDMYEQVSYEIHQFGNNITAEQYLTLTEKNLKRFEEDDQYQEMMDNHKLPVDAYVKWLTNQNYQCQNKNS